MNDGKDYHDAGLISAMAQIALVVFGIGVVLGGIGGFILGRITPH